MLPLFRVLQQKKPGCWKAARLLCTIDKKAENGELCHAYMLKKWEVKVAARQNHLPFCTADLSRLFAVLVYYFVYRLKTAGAVLKMRVCPKKGE